VFSSRTKRPLSVRKLFALSTLISVLNTHRFSVGDICANAVWIFVGSASKNQSTMPLKPPNKDPAGERHASPTSGGIFKRCFVLARDTTFAVPSFSSRCIVMMQCSPMQKSIQRIVRHCNRRQDIVLVETRLGSPKHLYRALSIVEFRPPFDALAWRQLC
jgi:hypothetical protein